MSKHIQDIGVSNWAGHFGKFYGRSKNEIICYDYIKVNKCNKTINSCNCIVDMIYNNKIIEFNGDFWHANPKLYESTFYNLKTHCTAQEIWNVEYERTKRLLDSGYKVLVIWEFDWINNRETVLLKVKEFLI